MHIAGRSKERLDQVATTDPELIEHRADGGDRDEIAAVAGTIGSIDWLVITLSGSEGPGPIADLDLTMLRRAFDAKFWGHVTTIQAVLPHLAPYGSITLLGAISARTGMPGTAGIAALNGAVEALVKPLAVELAPIRVNGVSPGFVDTPWWSASPADARATYFSQAAAVATRRGHRRGGCHGRRQPQPHRDRNRSRRRCPAGLPSLTARRLPGPQRWCPAGAAGCGAAGTLWKTVITEDFHRWEGENLPGS